MPQKANEVVILRSSQAAATDPGFRAAVLRCSGASLRSARTSSTAP